MKLAKRAARALSLVGIMAPAVPKRKRRPKASVVWIVDGVRGTRRANARALVRRAPRLGVLRELVPLGEVDSSPLVVDLLLRRLKLREVLAGHVHLDRAIDLLPRILFDDVDAQRGLLELVGGLLFGSHQCSIDTACCGSAARCVARAYKS